MTTATHFSTVKGTLILVICFCSFWASSVKISKKLALFILKDSLCCWSSRISHTVFSTSLHVFSLPMVPKHIISTNLTNKVAVELLVAQVSRLRGILCYRTKLSVSTLWDLSCHSIWSKCTLMHMRIFRETHFAAKNQVLDHKTGNTWHVTG